MRPSVSCFTASYTCNNCVQNSFQMHRHMAHSSLAVCDYLVEQIFPRCHTHPTARPRPMRLFSVYQTQIDAERDTSQWFRRNYENVQQLPARVWWNTKEIPKTSEKKFYRKDKSIFRHIHQVNRGVCYNVRPVFLFQDGRTMGPFSRRTMKFLRRLQLPTRSACPLCGLSMPETDNSHRGQGPGSTEGGEKFSFEILEYGADFAIGTVYHSLDPCFDTRNSRLDLQNALKSLPAYFTS